MSWSTGADLKAQLRRLWERGELLRALCDAQAGATEGPDVARNAAFPLRLTLKIPSSTELAQRFEAVRAWIADVAAVPHVRIEWREINHRVLGNQRLPQAAWVDAADDAFALLGKRGEATRFMQLLALTRARQPGLLPWLKKRPLEALRLAGEWEQLLAVTDWIVRRPRPAIYLRQVDLPGIHTKFIEQHRGVLAEWWELVVPPEAIDSARSGAAQFAARYGFLEKPVRIRFRVLDADLALLPGAASPDIALDAPSFARLTVRVRRVFITENETNFLAFPPVPESIVVFGAGYGWDALAQAEWLNRCTIYYWGDIDTHGFAILDQLRHRFAHVESFLMDRETLFAHQPIWGEEPDQSAHDLHRLTEAERALFDELRDNRIRSNLRLEQERVGFQRVEAGLRLLFSQQQ